MQPQEGKAALAKTPEMLPVLKEVIGRLRWSRLNLHLRRILLSALTGEYSAS